MGKRSQFAWTEYLEHNRSDINIANFRNWCIRNRPKKQIFNTEQELLETILLYDNRNKRSQFNWRQYLKENRPDINIDNFIYWCDKNRLKKQVFNTEQELLETILLYDNRNKRSQFNWKQYLQENRTDINIDNFKYWCIRNRPKKCIFDTEQELIETLQLYDNNKRSTFNWKQYLQENRLGINIYSFATWCSNNRPKKQVFNTEQELLQAISLYDNRTNKKQQSQFNWRQYLQEHRTDINIEAFKDWCYHNRLEKCVFDTEQELIEAIIRYGLCNKYILRKTKYQGIYNLTEKETGLKFNFYRIEDMIGLIQ